MSGADVIVRRLLLQDYKTCWDAMRRFTEQRDENTPDEIWLLQHHPVFSQGQNGKAEHLLAPGTIPVIQTDRGGQITYHGPGQLVVYALIDLRRKKLNIRQMVTVLEQSVIDLCHFYAIKATAKPDAPGVYVNDKKICSVGLRVKKGCTYHGLALNIDMDLEPFTRINPCGFRALLMPQLADEIKANNKIPVDMQTIETQLTDYLLTNLGYNTPHNKSGLIANAR